MASADSGDADSARPLREVELGDAAPEPLRLWFSGPPTSSGYVRMDQDWLMSKGGAQMKPVELKGYEDAAAGPPCCASVRPGSVHIGCQVWPRSAHFRSGMGWADLGGIRRGHVDRVLLGPRPPTLAAHPPTTGPWMEAASKSGWTSGPMCPPQLGRTPANLGRYRKNSPRAERTIGRDRANLSTRPTELSRCRSTLPQTHSGHIRGRLRPTMAGFRPTSARTRQMVARFRAISARKQLRHFARLRPNLGAARDFACHTRCGLRARAAAFSQRCCNALSQSIKRCPARSHEHGCTSMRVQVAVHGHSDPPSGVALASPLAGTRFTRRRDSHIDHPSRLLASSPSACAWQSNAAFS